MFKRLKIIFILFLIISCKRSLNSKVKTELDEKQESFSRVKLDYVDSLFIVETCLQFIKNKETFYEIFAGSKEFLVENVSTEHISYSPDSLKFVALYTINYKALTNDSLQGYYEKGEEYSHGMAAIGYRNSKKSIWTTVFPFNKVIIGLQPSRQSAYNELAKFYFDEIKTKSIGVTKFGPDDSKVINDFHKVNYTIQDSLFWTDSPIWKKGLRLEGYYAFEVNKNAGEVYPNSIKDKPILIYSDSLKLMYATRK